MLPLGRWRGLALRVSISYARDLGSIPEQATSRPNQAFHFSNWLAVDEIWHLVLIREGSKTLHGVGCVSDDKIFYLLFDLHIYAHFKCY